jgi:hypothetical protein
MNVGSKREIEQTMSVDDALEFFMFKRYNSYIDEKVMEHGR